MAKAGRPLIVIISPEAADDLRLIWKWNAERYSRDHADRYLVFLQTAIQALRKSFARDPRLPTSPEFRYRLIRRKPSGHGHIFVYRLVETELRLVRVYHSAQDWNSDFIDSLPNPS